MEAKRDLQRRLDLLDDDGMDRVLEFLKPEMGEGNQDDEVQLDLDGLTAARQHALVEVVDQILSQAATNSSTFPVVEPPLLPGV
jgi:hypothetical protein